MSDFKLHKAPYGALIAFGLTAVLIIVAYYGALAVPWHFDDKTNILENPAIQIASLTAPELAAAITHGQKSGVLRQASYFGFALNFHLARIITGNGFDVTTWHWVNIILHILTTYLIFLLSFDLLKRTRAHWDESWRYWISLCCAILFALNPIQTQTVTYIVQRMAGAAAFWYLLSLYLFIKHRSATRHPIPFFGNLPLVIWTGFTWFALYYIWRNQFSLGSGITGMAICLAIVLAISFVILIIFRQRKLFARRDGDIFLLLALISGGIALTTKENAITLPFFCWFYDYLFISGKDRNFTQRSLVGWISILVFFAFISPVIWVKNLATYQDRDFTLWERVLTEFRIVWGYLFLMIFPAPSRLNLDIDVIKSTSPINPFTTLVAIIAWLGAIGWSIKWLKRDKLISFLVLWYFGQLLVESSIIGLEFAYEHRFYLPGWGPILLLTIGIFALVEYISRNFTLISPKLFRALSMTVVMIAIFAISITWIIERNNVWADEIGLWRDVVAKSPNKVRPRVNLGFLLEADAFQIFDSAETAKTQSEHDRMIAEGTKLLSEAETEYYKALEMDPKNTFARVNLGHLYLQRGEFLRALDQFQSAEQIKADDPILQFNLGVTYKSMGDNAKAREHYEKALKLNPGYYEVLNNYGILEIDEGNLDRAFELFIEATKVNRFPSLAYYNLGTAYIKANKYPEAQAAFEKALEIKPDYVRALVNMANTMALQKNYEGAVRTFTRVLDIDPNHINTHFNLALIYMKQLNKPEEALYHLKMILKINPDVPQRAEVESYIRDLEGAIK